jgi:transaldolase / glucose-6-phosphate isomerase
VTSATYPGPIHAALDDAHRRLETSRFADALWSRRLEVWSTDPATLQKIASRLGWLESLAFIAPHLPRLRAVGESVKASGITDIVLLGMGGSSLAPEVLRSVVGGAPGFPRFHVLDSVDPDAVRAAMAHAGSSLFVLASKSGSTIEPNVLAAEAERRLRESGVADPWSHFMAITDEGTALHARASESRFRETFVNPADIGGRYSALSFFGLVPAALMGIDLDGIVASGRTMADACREPDPRRNPGLALGALMAAGALSGRDKLTLVLPPQFQRFGLWVEQLVAESTGKQGHGVVPITGEAGDEPIGPDRLIARWGSDQGSDQGSDRGSDQGSDRGSDRASDHPQIVLDAAGLGGEFFRWEFATATAGFLLGINPFDEPNVQQAKDATRALLDIYTAQGRLPVPEPDAAIEGVRITLSAAARQDAEDPRAFLRLMQPSDYFALLAFLPPADEGFAGVLEDLRHGVALKTGCAATLGYGPRYLHSTGQLHKGGPNTGVFLVVTAEPSPDLTIPGEPYSFGILEHAQALGDFESLNRAGRRALHIHLPVRHPDLLRQVSEILLKYRDKRI